MEKNTVFMQMNAFHLETTPDDLIEYYMGKMLEEQKSSSNLTKKTHQETYKSKTEKISSLNEPFAMKE